MLMVVLLQPQHIVLNLHVIFGRKHIDRIFSHMHSFFGLKNRHSGIFPKDIRQQTSVIR